MINMQLVTYHIDFLNNFYLKLIYFMVENTIELQIKFICFIHLNKFIICIGTCTGLITLPTPHPKGRASLKTSPALSDRIIVNRAPSSSVTSKQPKMSILSEVPMSRFRA